jgi:hypothetical protein
MKRLSPVSLALVVLIGSAIPGTGTSAEPCQSRGSRTGFATLP